MRHGSKASYCQPFSLTMWASSMMNFPSLYFWLASNACSYNKLICQLRYTEFVDVNGLTYFHPRVVLQELQQISATACSPVRRIRSSALPQPMFTLPQTTNVPCGYVDQRDTNINSHFIEEVGFSLAPLERLRIENNLLLKHHRTMYRYILRYLQVPWK